MSKFTLMLLKKLKLFPFYLIIIFIGLQSSKLAGQNTEALKANDSIILNYKLTYSANNTYGYDIYRNGKCIIKQSTIPGIPGEEGFKNKEQAEKVAKMVIEKIKKGIMPPSINNEELKALNIL
jgi:hypothetical protein